MKAVVRLALVAAFLLAISLPVLAQNEPPDFVQIITTTVRSNGVADYEDYIKNSGRNAIEHSESAVFRTLRNLSTRPRVNDPPAAFVMVVRTEIEPGMAVSYERYLSKLKAAQEQEQSTRTVNRLVSVLGPALTYWGANFFNKHADRDNWLAAADLMRTTYGDADGQELTDLSLRAVRKRDVFVQSYRPDLSRLAPVTRR